MNTGTTDTVPVVSMTAGRLVVEYPSFREFIGRSVSTLGEEGMFVETQTPQAAGSKFPFVVRIADGFQLMQGEAKVVAVRGAAEGQPPSGMSIRFQELDEPGRRLLAKIVDSHRRQGEPLFVLEVPATTAAGAAAVLEADDAGPREEEIPELAEIEANAREEAQLPTSQVAPPAETVPAPSPPPSAPVTEQSFADVEESTPSTLVTPPDDIGGSEPEPVTTEPAISVQDLPPVEAQPPLPRPPSIEVLEIDGTEGAASDSEDVQWEEPLAISPRSASAYESAAATPPSPEIRFTDGLEDVPVPDELVVASGALSWPDSEVVGEDAPEESPRWPSTGGFSKRRRPGWGVFLLLVLVILAGAAGYAYYQGLLTPYVDALTSAVASFVEGDSEVEVGPAVEPQPTTSEPTTGDAGADTTAPEATLAEAPPGARGAEDTQRVIPVVSKLSRIDRISWEELAGETLLMLWADDQVLRPQLELARVESGGARIVIKIYGVTKAPSEDILEVGTSHIRRIRTGLHDEAQGSVLHVVADLTGPDIYVREMEPQGSYIQVYFAKR